MRRAYMRRVPCLWSRVQRAQVALRSASQCGPTFPSPVHGHGSDCWLPSATLSGCISNAVAGADLRHTDRDDEASDLPMPPGASACAFTALGWRLSGRHQALPATNRHPNAHQIAPWRAGVALSEKDHLETLPLQFSAATAPRMAVSYATPCSAPAASHSKVAIASSWAARDSLSSRRTSLRRALSPP